MNSEVEAVRREYDSLATVYDRRWRHYVKVTLRAVVDRVPFQGNERVLDLACWLTCSASSRRVRFAPSIRGRAD
jgi:hypothetical protein